MFLISFRRYEVNLKFTVTLYADRGYLTKQNA